MLRTRAGSFGSVDEAMSIFLRRVREGMTGLGGERCHVCGDSCAEERPGRALQLERQRRIRTELIRQAADTGRWGSL